MSEWMAPALTVTKLHSYTLIKNNSNPQLRLEEHGLCQRDALAAHGAQRGGGPRHQPRGAALAQHQVAAGHQHGAGAPLPAHHALLAVPLALRRRCCLLLLCRRGQAGRGSVAAVRNSAISCHTPARACSRIACSRRLRQDRPLLPLLWRRVAVRGRQQRGRGRLRRPPRAAGRWHRREVGSGRDKRCQGGPAPLPGGFDRPPFRRYHSERRQRQPRSPPAPVGLRRRRHAAGTAPGIGAGRR